MTFYITTRKVNTMEIPDEVIRTYLVNYFTNEDGGRIRKDLSSMTTEELIEEFNDLDYLYSKLKDGYKIHDDDWSNHESVYLDEDEAYRDMEFGIH